MGHLEYEDLGYDTGAGPLKVYLLVYTQEEIW